MSTQSMGGYRMHSAYWNSTQLKSPNSIYVPQHDPLPSYNGPLRYQKSSKQQTLLFYKCLIPNTWDLLQESVCNK